MRRYQLSALLVLGIFFFSCTSIDRDNLLDEKADGYDESQAEEIRNSLGFTSSFSDSGISSSIVESSSIGSSSIPSSATFSSSSALSSSSQVNMLSIIEGGKVQVTMSEDGNPKPFALLLHAYDTSSTLLTWSIKTNPQSGAASVVGSGKNAGIAYSAQLNFFGKDSFVVQVSNGGATVATLVLVTIESVNDTALYAGIPVVSGSAVSGEVLTVDEGSICADIDGTAQFTYQWFRDTDQGGADGIIVGANSKNYSLVLSDVNHYVYAKVTCVDDGGLSVTKMSGYTGVIAKANLPPIIVIDSLISIADTLLNGTVLGRIDCNDPDSSDQLTITIIGGNALNIFKISSDSLIIADRTNLFHSLTGDTVSLKIEVCDGLYRDTATIAIVIEAKRSVVICDFNTNMMINKRSSPNNLYFNVRDAEYTTVNNYMYWLAIQSYFSSKMDIEVPDLRGMKFLYWSLNQAQSRTYYFTLRASNDNMKTWSAPVELSSYGQLSAYVVDLPTTIAIPLDSFNIPIESITHIQLIHTPIEIYSQSRMFHLEARQE